MLGKLLFAAVVAGGVFYFYPLWSEQAPTACRAEEQRVLTVAASSRAGAPARTVELAVLRRLEPLSGGALAAAAAKRHYPALPPQLGCTAGYWQGILR